MLETLSQSNTKKALNGSDMTKDKTKCVKSVMIKIYKTLDLPY